MDVWQLANDRKHHITRMDNPKVTPRKSPVAGNGLFALEAIKAGEEIASFDGETYTWTDPLENLPNSPPLYVEDHAIPIGEWEARDSAGFARVANHSCSPNCGIRDRIRIVALRDISTGEEITWDYDMVQDDEIWDMTCLCGAANCRKRIAGYRFMPPDRRKAYQGFISDWLLDPPRPFVGYSVDILGPVGPDEEAGRRARRQPRPQPLD